MYGHVFDPESTRVLDDGIAVVMRGPASYTGEDVVELDLHGSPVILDSVVRLIVAMGARPADRGEFTRRAFLSGRIDLLQAEAVIDLIEATNPLAAEEARSRLDRELSSKIEAISEGLTEHIAMIEAHIDFDEDDEIPLPDPLPLLRVLLSRMEELIRSANTGRVKREGIRTVIVGKPNVGKSTLFNTLLRSDRMIVTPYPGTTRDAVEERLILNDIPFSLWDTAGIREHTEPIEAEGIRRTYEQLHRADAVLAVFDCSRELDEEDRAVTRACSNKTTLIVLNKSDLGLGLDPLDPDLGPGHLPRIQLSASTGSGVDSLVHSLESLARELLGGHADRSPSALTQRCVQLMVTAAYAVRNAISLIENREIPGPEIISLELHRALSALHEITGACVDDAILDRIFERFCVGK